MLAKCFDKPLKSDKGVATGIQTDPIMVAKWASYREFRFRDIQSHSRSAFGIRAFHFKMIRISCSMTYPLRRTIRLELQLGQM